MIKYHREIPKKNHLILEPPIWHAFASASPTCVATYRQ